MAQKASTDAQVAAFRDAAAAQKASTDAQVAALKTSTDAQIKAVIEVADAYKAILQRLTEKKGK